MKHKGLVLVLVIVLAGVMLAACGSNSSSSSSSDTKDSKKLVVAMELAYPPFETKDADGNPSGVSVDFAKDFAAYLGKDIQIDNTAWDGLIPSLQSDKADMVISSMTITDERKKTVDFSDPYANALLAVLVNKNSNITAVDDLNAKGKKVAVKTGSTGESFAQKNLPNAEIVSLADESACATEVAQGKADGFIYDQLTIYRDQQANDGTTTAVYIPNQTPEKWGVAVKKGNTALLNELNTFIAKYQKEGGFDKLSTKYLSNEKKAFDQLGFKWFFDLSN